MSMPLLGRRQALAMGLCAAGLPAQGRAAAKPTAARTLKFGCLLSVESQLGAAGTAFADEIARRCGDRLRVDLYPNAVLGGEVEMLKAVQIGALDLAIITGAPLPNVLPEAGVFNIPFLFRDAAHGRAVLDGSIGRAYLDKFRTTNMVGLAWGENGLRHITNSRRPIREPQDLKGLRLRLPQSDVMLAGFRDLGADPAPLPFPQVFDALKQGRFDAQENPLATIRSSGFDKVQHHLSLTGHVYDPAVVLASLDVVEDVGPEDTAILADAARLAADASRRYGDRENTEGLAALIRAGMRVVTDPDRGAFAQALIPAAPEFDRMFGADLINQIRQHR
jgi:tripartite ATP-independent transporter DctP family solute receptor